MTVVNLFEEQPKVWVCHCGCSSFSIFQNGDTKCQNCGVVSDDGGWTPKPDKEWEGGEPFHDIVGNGSVEFARARLNKLATDSDACVVVVAMADGAVHAWSCADTQEQLDWSAEQIDRAKDLIQKRPLDE